MYIFNNDRFKKYKYHLQVFNKLKIFLMPLNYKYKYGLCPPLGTVKVV